MNLELGGKVFIVTGGSKGIGAGITKTLIEEGGSVVIATRSEGEDTYDFINKLKKAGGMIELVIGDLQTPGQCGKVVDLAIEKFGQIHGVVNNAGINDGVGIESGIVAFEQSLKKNLYHYYELVHLSLPHLKASRGAIVNISSKVALTGQGNTSGYAAAKGAQLALTREWAAELAPFGIRVNAVLPAEVMTPLYRRWLDSNFADPAIKERQITSKIPLGKRMTTTDEIASMVAFLLSAKSSHTTGQWVMVDGGYVHLDRSLT